MHTFTKQSYESFIVSMNFSYNFSSSEEILLTYVEVTDRAGTDVSSTISDQTSISVNTARDTMSVRVLDGSRGSSPYNITFKCTTTANNKWEGDVKMRIL